MAESFSEDILVEILIRLPVKSLLRFRCVQKSWYHLIQTRYFINLHSHHKKYRNKHLLFRYGSRCSLRNDDKQCKEYCPVEPCYKNIENTYIKTYGTSNGLICLAGREISHGDSLSCVYLWNPIISKFKSLPDSPMHDDPHRFPFEAGLAFGYLAKKDDYKVIKFTIHHDKRGEPRPYFVCVHVYSLSTNSWKTISNDNFTRFSFYGLHPVACLEHHPFHMRDSIVVNSAAYWLRSNKDHSMKGIFCFDVEKEVFREILLPPQCCKLKISYSVKLVQRFSELLSLFYFNMHTKILEIFVLEKVGEMNEVWTNKITLDFKRIDGRWWPVGFRNNGDIVLTKMEVFGYLSYDPQKNVATEFVEDYTGLWYGDVFGGLYNFRNKVYVDYTTCGKQPLYLDLFEENLVLLDE